MSPARRSLFWLAALLFVIIFLVLLSGILLPFVAGMALAYFLDPLADRLEARRVPRGLATTLVLAAFFIVFVAVLLLLLPLLQGQLIGMVQQLPSVIRAAIDGLASLLETASTRIDPQQMEDIRAALTDLQKEAAGWVLSAVRGIWSSGLAVLNVVGLLFITPVVAWYLLRDWDQMVARIDAWLPRDHADTIREQTRQIDRTLAGFVRGQAMVCLILGVAYAVALELAGLRYGLAVGMIAGLISFIPYVGSLVGLVLSVGLGYLQFGFSLQLGVLALIFFAGQAVEGNFLTPKLVGERVGLHAVWVMFALLAGGALFGFVGVLLAVPVAAIIGVLVRFALNQYLDSALFHGARSGGAGPQT